MKTSLKQTLKKLACVTFALVLATMALASCGTTNYTADNTTYYLGGTGPLTGDNSAYGISVQNGAQLAIDVINGELGGLNGVEFSLKMIDDQCDPTAASNGYTTLFEDGVQATIGSVTSGACSSFAAGAFEDNVFLITPSASAEACIAENNAFRICFGDEQQGELAAEELAATFTNIGAIYDSSDTYSSGLYNAFAAKLDEMNVSYKTQSFTSENNKDFSTAVETLKDCDVIFLPIYYTEAALIAKACVAKGCDAALFGCDGLDGIADQFSASDNIPNEIRYITPFDVNSEDAKVAAFVSAYEAKYNSKPDQFAADAYDAVMVIYEAMKKAGVSDVTISASDLCDVLVSTVTASDFSYEGVTGTMSWETSGSCNKVAQIVTYEK
jgi:branched-chain amino acid transport system substrate-binding protein